MLAKMVLALAACSAVTATAQDLVGSPRVLIEKGGQYATITFPTLPPAEIRVDANQLEGLIVSFGTARSQLVPAYPHQISPGQGAIALFDPGWAAQKHSDGDLILAIRDPRYGWLNYKLPAKSAEKLAQTIMNSPVPKR